MDKLEQFLTNDLIIDRESFDIETSIKICRDLKYYDLALKLAENRQTDLYLEIIIENKKDY